MTLKASDFSLAGNTPAADPFDLPDPTNPVVVNAGSRASGRYTLTVDDASIPTTVDDDLLVQWRSNYVGVVESSPSGIGFACLTKEDPYTVPLPDHVAYLDDVDPFTIDRSARSVCRFIRGASRGLSVAEPEPGDARQYYTLYVRIPRAYHRRDLAEILLGVLQFQAGIGTAARDGLSSEALIAYSERQADPRYGQHLSINLRIGETARSFIGRALSSTDAILAFTNDGKLALYDHVTVSELATPLEISSSDAGASMFLMRDLRIRRTTEFMVNRRRLILGSLLEIGTPADPSTTSVGELPSGENVVELVDQNSIDAYGEISLDERIDYAADLLSLVGPARASTWAAPSREVTFVQGPLHFDYDVGNVIRIDAPERGITTEARFLVIEKTIDWKDASATVVAIEIHTASPEEIRLPSSGTPDLGVLARWSADKITTALPQPPAGTTVPEWENRYAGLSLANYVTEANGKLTAPSVSQRPQISSETLNGVRVVDFSQLSRMDIADYADDEAINGLWYYDNAFDVYQHMHPILYQPTITVLALVKLQTASADSDRTLVSFDSEYHSIPGLLMDDNGTFSELPAYMDDKETTALTVGNTAETQFGASLGVRSTGYKVTAQSGAWPIPLGGGIDPQNQPIRTADSLTGGSGNTPTIGEWRLFLWQIPNQWPANAYWGNRSAELLYYPRMRPGHLSNAIAIEIDPVTRAAVGSRRVNYGIQGHGHTPFVRFAIGNEHPDSGFGTSSPLLSLVADIVVHMRDDTGEFAKAQRPLLSHELDGMVESILEHWGF